MKENMKPPTDTPILDAVLNGTLGGIGKQPETPQHTPTPWRSYDTLDYGHKIFPASGECLDDHFATVENVNAQTESANAAFIVRACNSHDALVDALRAAEEFISKTCGHSLEDVACNARTALAAATQGGE